MPYVATIGDKFRNSAGSIYRVTSVTENGSRLTIRIDGISCRYYYTLTQVRRFLDSGYFTGI